VIEPEHQRRRSIDASRERCSDSRHGAAKYRIAVDRGSLGELLIDAGVRSRAALRPTCCGRDLHGRTWAVTLSHTPAAPKWPFG
jgi:hypothetical protein